MFFVKVPNTLPATHAEARRIERQMRASISDRGCYRYRQFGTEKFDIPVAELRLIESKRRLGQTQDLQKMALAVEKFQTYLSQSSIIS